MTLLVHKLRWKTPIEETPSGEQKLIRLVFNTFPSYRQAIRSINGIWFPLSGSDLTPGRVTILRFVPLAT
jgi:hypothetical protein